MDLSYRPVCSMIAENLCDISAYTGILANVYVVEASPPDAGLTPSWLGPPARAVYNPRIGASH